jgi:hypothetical protein
MTLLCGGGVCCINLSAYEVCCVHSKRFSCDEVCLREERFSSSI